MWPTPLNEGEVLPDLAGTPHFADEAKLADHFARHGADFGTVNEAEYHARAAQFLSGTPKGGALDLLRPDGDMVRYNPNTDEFGILAKDGIIRTYFKPIPGRHPYPSNLDYFYAQ